ncbi:MAG: hydroxymethylpyrimidine/phosphomethylpyrimidine kinase [Burkholderiaceae bacterium]|nr:MAG: hydroxymethylpyrimidine/phosphomethylpyrimidine kinase [Burkholderiaceae bacterium]
MPTAATPPLVMTFSASDPTGGAGLQADLLTLARLRCHALTVVTALTVQDTAGVQQVHAVGADQVAAQARALLKEMQVAAFKIGLLGSTENIMAIARILADYPDVPLVLDPVLASGRGDLLAGADQRDALCELLLPRTTVLTPNSLEARQLVHQQTDRETIDLPACAASLIARGCAYVLLTGSHEDTPDVCNTLYDKGGEIRRDRWPRLPGSYHGSGCTLASALAAYLAQGMDIAAAAQAAQHFTWHTLQNGFQPGLGQFLPDRMALFDPGHEAS